jgi:hypothetical protein
MIIADMLVESKSAVLAQPMYADNASIWHHMSDALHQSLYRVLSPNDAYRFGISLGPPARPRVGRDTLLQC